MTKLILGSLIAGAFTGVATAYVVRKRNEKKELNDIADSVDKLLAMSKAVENGEDTFEWNGDTISIESLTY